MWISDLWLAINHSHPIPTGKIADGLYAVKTETVNFFIFQGRDSFIAIDSGYGRQIASQLNHLGIDPLRVTHLFLTHSDFDHAGGLALFKNAEIYLSTAEIPLITRGKARALGFIYNGRIPRAYRALDDQQVVAAGATRVEAITTPGHTPGSMSYLVNEALLFTGDTFKLVDHKARPTRRYLNLDTEQQIRSIRKLAKLDTVQMACTAHSGYTTEFNQAMADWQEKTRY